MIVRKFCKSSFHLQTSHQVVFKVSKLASRIIEDATRKTRCLYRQPTLKSEDTSQQFLVLGDSPVFDCVIITTCPICLEVQSTRTVKPKWYGRQSWLAWRPWFLWPQSLGCGNIHYTIFHTSYHLCFSIVHYISISILHIIYLFFILYNQTVFFDICSCVTMKREGFKLDLNWHE